jgi:alkylation response protein AidB-like acyl-CoA dehydrogenase
MTLDYAATRVVFGRAIDHYQVIKHKLADMKVSLEVSRAALRECIDAATAADPGETRWRSVMKAYVGAAATQFLQDAIQVHGAVGTTWEHDLHLYLRRAVANEATLGTPHEHQRSLARGGDAEPALAAAAQPSGRGA